MKQYLLFLSGMLSSFLLESSSCVYAATWLEVSYNLNQNAIDINNCLRTAASEYQTRNPATPLEGQRMAVAALENANTCFEPVFQSLILDDLEINLSFRNTRFRNEIAIEGDFSIALENLVRSSSISSNALSHFAINNTECDLSNLNRFSYEVNPRSLELLKLEYASTIIDKVLEQNPANGSIASLQLSLREFISRPQNIIALAKVYSSREFISHADPSNLLTFLGAYGGIDSSPQINFVCESNAGSFSVASENGIVDVILVQQLGSDDDRFGFNFSNSSRTVSYNAQSLRINRKQRNNRIETTYQGVPLTVTVDQTINLPENLDLPDNFVVPKGFQCLVDLGEVVCIEEL